MQNGAEAGRLGSEPERRREATARGHSREEGVRDTKKWRTERIAEVERRSTSAIFHL